MARLLLVVVLEPLLDLAVLADLERRQLRHAPRRAAARNSASMPRISLASNHPREQRVDDLQCPSSVPCTRARSSPSGSLYRFSGDSDGPVIRRPCASVDHVVEQELARPPSSSDSRASRRNSTSRVKS